MKKVLIIVVILLLLCCCLSFVGFGLFDHFYNNNTCSFKGPFAYVASGPCAPETVVDDNNNQDVNNNNGNNNNNNNQNSSDTEVYSNGEYSFEYPSTFEVDESEVTSNNRVKVLAENGKDNILVSNIDQEITVSQSQCEDYADSTIDELSDYGALLLDVSTTSIGSLRACRVAFNADYDNGLGRIDQTQFYVDAGKDGYIITITTIENYDNYDIFTDVAMSFELE